MSNQPKNQHRRCCQISMRVIDRETGEQRQLSQEEIAEQFSKILSIPPAERIRQSRVVQKEEVSNGDITE